MPLHRTPDPLPTSAASIEVVARLQAAERLRHVEGCDYHADLMLAQARRWAELELADAP